MYRALDMGAEHAPGLGHDEGGPHVVSGNIGDDDIEGIIPPKEVVVVISAHVGGGKTISGNEHSRQCRGGGREKGPLDLLGDLHVPQNPGILQEGLFLGLPFPLPGLHLEDDGDGLGELPGQAGQELEELLGEETDDILGKDREDADG